MLYHARKEAGSTESVFWLSGVGLLGKATLDPLSSRGTIVFDRAQNMRQILPFSVQTLREEAEAQGVPFPLQLEISATHPITVSQLEKVAKEFDLQGPIHSGEPGVDEVVVFRAELPLPKKE